VVVDGHALDAGAPRDLADLRRRRSDSAMKLDRGLGDPASRLLLLRRALLQLIFSLLRHFA
jgi:hypothetical protein